MTEGNGIPLAVAVEGANRHDMKMVENTLKALMIERPEPTEENPQHLCMDKGYDYPEVRELVAALGIHGSHPESRRGGSFQGTYSQLSSTARAMEQTHSWLNRFRRLLVRWGKKVENYLAMLHFAYAWITFRAAKVFG